MMTCLCSDSAGKWATKRRWILTKLVLLVEMSSPLPSIMDVDHPLPTSGYKRTLSPSLAASTSKRPKYDTILIQPVQTVVTRMRQLASDLELQIRMDKAKDDESRWKPLISSVLSILTDVIETTDRNSDLIGSQSLSQAEQIVNGFSDEYLREWKEGVEKGIAHDDWEGLLKHRMYQT
jgi:hypothetical protein